MKRAVAILAAGLIGLGTGACGNSGGDSGSTSRTSPGAASATNPAQGGGEATKVPHAPPPKRANRGDSGRPGSGTAGSTARRYPPAAAESTARRYPPAAAESSVDRYPHGDNSIQTFGRRGGEVDRQAVAELVKRYYDALAADDGVKACSMMSSGISSSLVSELGRSPKLQGKGCGAILSLLFKGRGTAGGLVAPEVTSLRLKGAKGFALLRSKAVPAGEIPIVREHGVWKIAALIGSALP